MFAFLTFAGQVGGNKGGGAGGIRADAGPSHSKGVGQAPDQEREGVAGAAVGCCCRQAQLRQDLNELVRPHAPNVHSSLACSCALVVSWAGKQFLHINTDGILESNWVLQQQAETAYMV